MTSSESQGILIAGLGAATPVGRNALASAAAVRAGVSGFGEHAFMVDAVGLPMRVAAMPWVEESRGLADRIGDALLAAVHEALAPLAAFLPPQRVALFVNLPSPRPGLPADLASHISLRLRQELAGAVERISFTSLGHAGGLVALHPVQKWLMSAPKAACIVAGADSYLEPDTLEWLEETDQLHGAGERNNAWGFVPGEGAGALLLASSEIAQNLGLAPLGRIRAVGFGREAQLIRTGSVCLGHGLTDAVRAVLAALDQGERLTDVYCDMNGEPYRADEYAFLVTRTRERFVSASDFVAPADCWGDVGAASVPLLVVLACIAGIKRYANGPTALVWASSVGGERGAALVDTPGPG